MSRSGPFEYVEQISQELRDSYVARMRADVRGKDELLRSLCECLRLPGYFGFNWDALSDCLRDLHWMDSHCVVLVHDALPVLSESELSIYVGVLADAVASWETGDEHSLRVIFPFSAKTSVTSALQHAGQ